MTIGKRFDSLDSLRGIAAVCVLLFHSKLTSHLGNTQFVSKSYLFVDFFFILSGFVISHSAYYKIKNAKDVKEFLRRRWLRIYPLHFCLLLMFLCIEFFKYFAQLRQGPSAEIAAFTYNSAEAFFANMFLVQIFVGNTHLSFNSPSWSIAAEAQTYVVFSFACIFLRKLSNRSQVLILAIACMSAFAMLRSINPSLQCTDSNGFLRCVGGFSLGMIAFKIYEFLSEKNQLDRMGWLPGLSIAVALVALAQRVVVPVDYWMPLLFFFTIVSIVANPSARVNRVMCWSPLKWLGERSYSIYMIHFAVLAIVTQVCRRIFKISDASGSSFTPHSQWVGTLALTTSVALVLFLADKTYKYIELRFTRGPRHPEVPPKIEHSSSDGSSAAA